ncbi:hypothetical protein [Solwaraspora sp. WMMA2065]|uniref:hypothetical protein n=1 Tax=Solwaraspora sp. WMMA2065 TaxID=3015166 RepID=UPI00259BC832|nr:hypothetical protein [Solwaraspora sp. WMMA2065]WJK33055.1 hypothetical protein O7610_20335 [Solwaraspora sp. WMMA2065]
MSTSSGKQPTSGSGADPAPKPSRRVFSPEYKLAMVAEYENAPNGEKGAILRREGPCTRRTSLSGHGRATPGTLAGSTAGRRMPPRLGPGHG